MPDFQLFDEVCAYRIAKKIAENGREHTECKTLNNRDASRVPIGLAVCEDGTPESVHMGKYHGYLVSAKRLPGALLGTVNVQMG